MRIFFLLWLSTNLKLVSGDTISGCLCEQPFEIFDRWGLYGEICRANEAECYNLPHDAPDSTVVFYLNDNHFTVLRNGTFNKYNQLYELIMGGNSISKIEPGAFGQNNVNFRNMYLWENNVTDISDVVLALPPSTNFIDFDKNPITRISNNSFTTLPLLLHLTIRYLPFVVTLEEAAFQGLDQLGILNLRGTKFSSKNLPRNLLLHTPALGELHAGQCDLDEFPNLEPVRNVIARVYLNTNQFTSIPKFNYTLPMLTTLDLRYNSIVAFDSLGGCCQALTKLMLVSNEINSVDPDAFTVTTNFEILDLQNNNISDVSFIKAFPNLQSINVTKNAVKTVPKSVTNGRGTALEIRLTYNPLECNSDLCWLFHETSIIYPTGWSSGSICASPPNYVNLTYEQLLENYEDLLLCDRLFVRNTLTESPATSSLFTQSTINSDLGEIIMKYLIQGPGAKEYCSVLCQQESLCLAFYFSETVQDDGTNCQIYGTQIVPR